MEIYSKKIEQDGSYRVKILGITVKRRYFKKGYWVKKYLGGIYKNKRNDEKKVYYILGIQTKETFFKKSQKSINKDNKELPVTRKDINKILARLDDIYFNMQVLVQVPTVHKYFAKYKNCNAGKDVVLLAGGPTIRYYDYKNSTAIKCGVNGIIALVDNLDYLITEDIFIWDKNLNEEIDNYKGNNCQKFYGILPQRRIKKLNKNEHFTDRIRPLNIYNSNANIFLIEDVVRAKWAIDLETEAFGDFGGCVFSALQFIAFTHPKKILLAGCDCSKAPMAYSSKRPKDSDNTLKIKSFESFKYFVNAVYPEIEIISINPVGLKGLFKDVYTKSYLAEHPEIAKENPEVLEDSLLCGAV